MRKRASTNEYHKAKPLISRTEASGKRQGARMTEKDEGGRMKDESRKPEGRH